MIFAFIFASQISNKEPILEVLKIPMHPLDQKVDECFLFVRGFCLRSFLKS